MADNMINNQQEQGKKVLIMATNNEHKLREVRQILEHTDFTVKGLADIGCTEDIPETANTLEGNALQKARYVHEHYGLDSFADDTGLEVEALDGAPGIFTARFGMMNGYGDSHDTEANINCLLDKLKDKASRKARFRTAIALIHNGEEHLFEGIVEGEILKERTGGNGFGYDPIFAPTEAQGKSFAEMGPEGKNTISHRARATQKLVEFLRRSALLLLCCLMPLLAKAATIGEWQVYRAYQNATQCALAGSMVYVNFNGNLLSYDTEDTDVRTYDILNGLNGVTIKHIAYCPLAKRLVIAYDDSGIDLMDSNGTTFYIGALKDKSIGGKVINSITIDGSMAYLATDFGMVELDVKEGYLRNSYQTGFDAQSVVKVDDDYLIASKQGLYIGRKDANLFTKENWEKLDGGSWSSLIATTEGMAGLRWNCPYTYSKATGVKYRSDFRCTFVCATDQGLIWGNNDKVYTGKSDFTDRVEMKVSSDAKPWLYIQAKGSTLWACEGESGIHPYRLTNGEWVRSTSPIQLDSPIRDLSYHITWVGDRLLVAGGRNDEEMGLIEPTAMTFEDGKWTIFKEMELPDGKVKSYRCNTTNLVQDPNDPTHHFASSYRTGLMEYRDGKFVKLYDNTNSTLSSILPTDPYSYLYVSCSGAQYDADGNLWVLSSLCADAVHYLDPKGKWHALHYDEVDKADIADNYLMHSSGIRFFNIRWGGKRGIFAFDTKETTTNVKDDRHRLRNTIVNQDGTSYVPDFFYNMAEDLDGRIWCGTNLGVFVINNADEFFNDGFQFEQVKVSRNDGSGLADYLLNGTAVNCIAIDGGNRKWIGTTNDGVYLISADGQEMIHHFTTADSPILSDAIQSIAVHPTTGVVMIGTDRGLCSYVADATEAAEELDKDNIVVFPNPVTPDYTGPIAVRGLPMDSEVKILSASGQLVWSGVSNGGTFTWNGCLKSGKRASSGVYHIVANTPEGNKAIVSRIIFIR